MSFIQLFFVLAFFPLSFSKIAETFYVPQEANFSCKLFKTPGLKLEFDYRFASTHVPRLEAHLNCKFALRIFYALYDCKLIKSGFFPLAPSKNHKTSLFHHDEDNEVKTIIIMKQLQLSCFKATRGQHHERSLTSNIVSRLSALSLLKWQTIVNTLRNLIFD